jgi:hypothetical protein
MAQIKSCILEKVEACTTYLADAIEIYNEIFSKISEHDYFNLDSDKEWSIIENYLEVDNEDPKEMKMRFSILFHNKLYTAILGYEIKFGRTPGKNKCLMFLAIHFNQSIDIEYTLEKMRNLNFSPSSFTISHIEDRMMLFLKNKWRE